MGRAVVCDRRIARQLGSAPFWPTSSKPLAIPKVMNILKNSILESAFLLLAVVIWCEVGYYYAIIAFRCQGWPSNQLKASQGSFVNLLVLSDTHIMGPTKSVWLDKIRREWQMRQAFRIINYVHQPNAIVILGDILDEGSYNRDNLFLDATKDFYRVFPLDSDCLRHKEHIILAGNHDVGLHNHMVSYPYFLERFVYKYNATSSASLIKLGDLNIVVINSMALYNDTCPFCIKSIEMINQIGGILENSNSYSAPIVLQHIPLYRQDDISCDYPNSMRDRVLRTNNKEGNDVLHKKASNFILTKLKPRLVLSGHTHMNCLTVHELANQSLTQELTVTSFNHKYAERLPGFLLISANSTHVFTNTCNLIDELVVLGVYIASLVAIVFRFIIKAVVV